MGLVLDNSAQYDIMCTEPSSSDSTFYNTRRDPEMKNLFTIAFLVIVASLFTWGVQELKEAAKVNYSDLNHRMEKMECNIAKKENSSFDCDTLKRK